MGLKHLTKLLRSDPERAIPRAEHCGAGTIVETPLSDTRIGIPLP